MGEGQASGDNYQAWCMCPACGKLGIEFDGRGARVCGSRCCPDDDKLYTYNEPPIIDAYIQATMERF